MGCKAIMASHRTPGPIDNPLNFERGTAAPVRDPKVARFAVRLCVPSVEDDCLRTGTNSTHQSPRNTDPADATTKQFRTRSQRLVALVLAPRLTLGILSCSTSTLALPGPGNESPQIWIKHQTMVTCRVVVLSCIDGHFFRPPHVAWVHYSGRTYRHSIVSV